MGKKKKSFLNWDELTTYCSSEKTRWITLYVRPLPSYPGILESLRLYSTNSGKHLELVQDFECLALDDFGDTSEQTRYPLHSLNSLKEIMEKNLQLTISDLTTGQCAISFEFQQIQNYTRIWDNFLEDFRNNCFDVRKKRNGNPLPSCFSADLLEKYLKELLDGVFSFSEKMLIDWCGQALNLDEKDDCFANPNHRLAKALEIASDMDAQWELYLTNTYSVNELQALDFAQVHLPKKFYQEWLHTLQKEARNE